MPCAELKMNRASALVQMARVGGVSVGDQLWSRAEQSLAAVQLGHTDLGRQVVPEWRLAYVRAALAFKEGSVQEFIAAIRSTHAR